MPTVSVIIPTYNSSRYITDTVNAILSQSLQDFEIIVVDDCSTDNTISILESFNDARIKIFVNEINRGIPYTHNRLIGLCESGYIAIQDHDDISYPYRLQTQVDFLRSKPALLATASYPTYIDEEGRSLHPIPRKILRMLGLNNSNAKENEIFACMFFKNIFCHSTVMLNKKNLGSIRYQEDFAICDDYDLLIRIAEKNAVCIHRKPVLKYRIHRQNTSSLRVQERENEINAIQSRYFTLLSIEPDAGNLFLHNGFFNNTVQFKPDTGYLIKTQHWFKMIIEKNKQFKSFDQKALYKAIEINWFERCYACRGLGTGVYKIYMGMRLHTGRPLFRLAKSMVLLFSILSCRDK